MERFEVEWFEVWDIDKGAIEAIWEGKEEVIEGQE